MKIAVDLDAVCCKFIKGFLPYMNIRLGLDIKPEQITKWDWWELDLGLTQEQWIECLKKFTEHRMWQSLEVYDDITPSLCSLADQGHELFYLTDRPKKARRATLKFLLSNGLPVDGVIFCKNKAPIAKALGVAVSIDDKIETVEDYYDVGINSVLRCQPYNEIATVYTKKVNSFREFHDYVVGLEEK